MSNKNFRSVVLCGIIEEVFASVREMLKVSGYISSRIIFRTAEKQIKML